MGLDKDSISCYTSYVKTTPPTMKASNTMNADKIKEVIKNLRHCDDYHGNIEHDTFDNAIETIEQLRKERDEARREVCRLLDKDSEFRVPNEIAAKRKGWDCYEKETH